ncbi:ferredoxin [Catenuloplanes indicus]|uniref:Ferredoxin n=1 Tax=Catenuloplanes indicus TaxID=137267 RepID=A0AAE3W3N2_9ACTN|nr:ferredoxin [Catenuloplanes indicus]MDQ0368771.1 ferredoxin [Catenuloplanes indicus]
MAKIPQAEAGQFLRVNPIACVARGMCAELLPEQVKLDEWGYPILKGDPLPPQLVAHARRAIAECPTLALRSDPTPRG